MKKKIGKLMVIVIALTIIICVAMFAVIKKKKELAKAKPLEENAIPVKVESVKQGNFILEKRYIGVIEPLTSANISSRITADIVKVFYREGKYVKQGDLLLKLDARNLRQAITVLKAKVEGIKTELTANNVNIASLKNSVNYWETQTKRDKRLFKKNIVSAKQLELSNEHLNEVQGKLYVTVQRDKTLKAQLDAAEGDMKIAETNLSYADIKAPFDGVVCDVPIDPGDLAAPGKKLMVFENQQQMKVVVQLPQVDIKYVHLGDELQLQCGNKTASVKISKIYPALGSNRMVKVEAVLPMGNKNGFISGQYVKVAVDAKKIDNVLIVPSAAINIDNRNNRKHALFIVKNGMLKKVNIKILGDNRQTAAVSGKLKVGDKVVVSAYLGWAKFANGLKAEEVK